MNASWTLKSTYQNTEDILSAPSAQKSPKHLTAPLPLHLGPPDY